jgi:hypothetical protein
MVKFFNGMPPRTTFIQGSRGRTIFAGAMNDWLVLNPSYANGERAANFITRTQKEVASWIATTTTVENIERYFLRYQLVVSEVAIAALRVRVEALLVEDTKQSPQSP